MGKIAFIILLTLIASTSLFAQDIKGTWSGDLNFGNNISMTLVIHIDGFSPESVTLDSPDQATYGIKVDKAEFNEENFSIEINNLDAKLTCNTKPINDSLFCQFTQRGKTTPINMKRGYTPKPKKQDPKDFPYIVEEIDIHNPKTNITLSGTLTAPYDFKCDKVVILVSGSGAQNRDEEILGHKPFLVLSDYLTRNGIAVIRYDDRGFGKSTGDFASATTYDFSLDAESVVEFINNDERLKGKKIGIIGHSEGGMIAPMIAARNNNVDFIVMLAGPAVPISELMVKQNYDVYKASGASEEMAQMNAKYAEKMYKVMKSNKPIDVQKSEIVKIQIENLSKLPGNANNEEGVKEIAQSNVNMLFLPWMYNFIRSNPQDNLSKVRIPVLALNGDKDVQVSCKENLAGFEKCMKKAKNQNYKSIELKGLNHLFQKCIFGSPNFYGKNEESFNEDAMKEIVEWINNL